ncbi:hypothetical protein AGLY_003875 [Aphis glycines]|uniref:Uncharacterized protein n=1 Tax=Aphis glycines TaxID=307491 RepID=A0A6G0U1Y2_APHGL|nr:hypothetical protein AGLY_003875 [Aphis glycines]
MSTNVQLFTQRLFLASTSRKIADLIHLEDANLTNLENATATVHSKGDSTTCQENTILKTVEITILINELDQVCDRTRDRHRIIADKPHEHLISTYSLLYRHCSKTQLINNKEKMSRLNTKKAGKWVPFCCTLGGGVDLGLRITYEELCIKFSKGLKSKIEAILLLHMLSTDTNKKTHIIVKSIHSSLRSESKMGYEQNIIMFVECNNIQCPMKQLIIHRNKP